MKPQTSRVAAFALFGWLAEGCTIRAEVNVDEEAGGATSSIEDPTYDPCVAADSLPDDDKHAAMEAAEARLASEGKSLADAWSDPETFQLLQRAAYREVGCDLSAASAAVPGEQQQPLHDDSGPDYYCGPGHGANRLIVPSVSACLNAACREHDACYAQCSEPTGAFCMWGGPTSTCDEPFMDAMRCRDDAHQFNSTLVRHVARKLYELGLTAVGCSGAMTCPGEGPCLVQPGSPECAFCLDKLDVGGVCLARACDGERDDSTCYRANCPAVGGCYGGYNVPKPPDATPVIVTPESMWSLTVLQAAIPDFKPSGEPWDVDANGFASPDVSIGVRVGSADAPQFRTAQVEDSLVPMWQGTPPLLVASATDLQTLVQFTATDGDLAFDDAIGTCATTVALENFDGQAVEFVCADQEQVRFTVYFSLAPAL